MLDLTKFTQDIIEESCTANGFSLEEKDQWTSQQMSLVILYAKYIMALDNAFDTASDFKFTDGDESIDKKQVSTNYKDLAEQLYTAWLKAKSIYDASVKSYFTIMKRPDRSC